MMIKKSGLICLMIACSLAFVSGMENDVGPLTLEQCLAIALEKNPLLLSSLQQYRASLARVQQARAIPQPLLEFDSDLQPLLFNFRRSGESYFGLSQTVEFPGKRNLRGKIASSETDELLMEIDFLKLDLVFQVKEAFFNLLAAWEKVKYAEEDRELALDYLNKAQAKFEAGEVALVEVLRARVEAARTANEVRIARNEERLARAQLNFFLARNKYQSLEIKGQLKSRKITHDLEELKEKALALRPEMRKIIFSSEKESLARTQGYLNYLPDFDLGIARHSIQGEEKTWQVTLSLPIPLFFWQPRKGEIAEAEANLRALQREAEHLRNAISLEVEEAYTNALATENQIDLFESEILLQAEEVYNMFLFSYEEGEISGIELIEARRTLIETRKAYIEALYNFEVALAALEKAIGQKLEGV